MIYDLRITADQKLLAATHGKGIFKSDLFTSTLPVTMIDFGGKHVDHDNKIHWTVTQQQNIANYELQRSNDGMNYQTIATISPRSSQTEITYNYNDPVGILIKEYYYRLKIVDNDRSIKYSAVIFIRVTSKDSFNVLGNPFVDNILLQYNLDQDQLINIKLFNSAGIFLRKEGYAASAGSGVFTINGMGRYPAGVYFLKIESGGDQQTIRLVKN
jgi:hypothetical protein